MRECSGYELTMHHRYGCVNEQSLLVGLLVGKKILAEFCYRIYYHAGKKNETIMK